MNPIFIVIIFILCSSSTPKSTTMTSQRELCTARGELFIRLESVYKQVFLRLVRDRRMSIIRLDSFKKSYCHVLTIFVQPQASFQQVPSIPVQPSLLPRHHVCKKRLWQPSSWGQACSMSGWPKVPASNIHLSHTHGPLAYP